MKLIVISNPFNVNNEHEIVCSLFENGLNCYHLRKPDFTREQMEEILELVPKEYLGRIVLHSHHGLVEQFQLKGAHSKLPFYSSSEGKSLSASFHSIEECIGCKEEYDYAFLSPVFDSISKRNYKATLDKEKLSSFLNGSGRKEIIAMGGINEQTIPVAKEYGFDGVATLGAVWMADDPVEKFRRLLSVCNSVIK
jgi:thiamine-phosphate pyrophosphorylase